MAKLAILCVEEAYYGELRHRNEAGFEFGEDRYVLRTDSSSGDAVIIDRQARLKMVTNAVFADAGVGRVAIYGASAPVSRLESLTARMFSKPYRLPNAPRAYRRFELLDEAALLSLVESYQAKNPDPWERIPRKRLEESVESIRYTRGTIAFVFAAVFVFASLATLVFQSLPEKDVKQDTPTSYQQECEPPLGFGFFHGDC